MRICVKNEVPEAVAPPMIKLGRLEFNLIFDKQRAP